nr:MAG TPA: hypothetical protein [Caudoviricetes sp.]
MNHEIVSSKSVKYLNYSKILNSCTLTLMLGDRFRITKPFYFVSLLSMA